MFRLGIALVLVAACGGKGKDAKTTPGKPGAGSGDQSMNDKSDPTGGPNGTPGANPADPNNPGSPGSPGGGPSSGPDPTGPAVVPPNLDPDPAQAKTQVDAHLTIAKNALAQPVPDAEKALAEAKEALKLDAANVDAAAMVAFAYYHKKLFDTAELVLDDLFKREAAKQNAQVYYVYGLIYEHTNRPERALLAYKKAVELNPSHASALVNLGVFQLRNSQYTEAQATFERLTQQFNRRDAVTLTSLGSSYRGRSADYKAGDAERDKFVRSAEQAYKSAEQANPSYGPVYYNLGLLYLDTDPYPGIDDTVQRLGVAKAYFDKYKNMQGVDIKLFDSRMKDVDKAIKRAEKQKKQKEKADKKSKSAPPPSSAPGATPPSGGGAPG